jgi:hypothetical protein
MIWRHALTTPDERLQYDTASRRLDVTQIGASVSATCHQIAQETRHMHLRLNKICFDVQGFLRCQRRLMAVEGEVEWELVRTIQVVAGREQ